MPTATKTAKPATDKQIDFAIKLVTENANPPLTHEATVTLREGYRAYTSKQMSGVIDTLLANAQQAKSKVAVATAAKITVPAGKFAVHVGDEVVRYQIDRPDTGKWAGWLFIKLIEHNSTTPIRDADEKAAILAAIEGMGALESTKLYGKTTGVCGMCGKTLTDPDSVTAGIGPVCEKKWAWNHPNGY